MGFIRAFDRYYPPRRYVFLPLYRQLRHQLGIPMAGSILLVYLVSAVLHAAVTLAFGNPVASLVFGSLFVVFGIVSMIAVLAGKQTSKRVLRRVRQVNSGPAAADRTARSAPAGSSATSTRSP